MPSITSPNGAKPCLSRAVVAVVDEELRGARVGRSGLGERDHAALVLPLTGSSLKFARAPHFWMAGSPFMPTCAMKPRGPGRSGAVIEAVLDEVVETIGAKRRPLPRDLDHERAGAGVEAAPCRCPATFPSATRDLQRRLLREGRAGQHHRGGQCQSLKHTIHRTLQTKNSLSLRSAQGRNRQVERIADGPAQRGRRKRLRHQRGILQIIRRHDIGGIARHQQHTQTGPQQRAAAWPIPGPSCPASPRRSAAGEWCRHSVLATFSASSPLAAAIT